VIAQDHLFFDSGEHRTPIGAYLAANPTVDAAFRIDAHHTGFHVAEYRLLRTARQAYRFSAVLADDGNGDTAVLPIDYAYTGCSRIEGAGFHERTHLSAHQAAGTLIMIDNDLSLHGTLPLS
jgi:hypothetical protein